MRDELHVPRGAGISVGGSELILAFLEEALRQRAERVCVLTPYVDDKVFEDEVLCDVWGRLLDAADATVVVRTPAAADILSRQSNGRRHRLDLRLNPRLHAKVFLAYRHGWEIALAGSHNLTAAALHANAEVGIVVRPAGAPELRRLVRDLRRIVEKVARDSNAVRRTT